MSAHVSDSTRYWKRLFLVLQTIVVVVFLFCLLAERCWGLRVEPQPQVWSVVFGASIMLAWLFLLIVSPFFLRSLWGVALTGWIIAFGILVVSLLTPAL
jgi:membrane protein YdbS with pleckstrin-like domain